MKNISIASLAVIGLALTGSVASAEELWDPHLRGVDEGLAAGATPPPGVYGVLNNYWAGYDKYDSSGHKAANGEKLDALVEVPIILWVPGWNVLGADYSAAIAQPFDYTNLKGLSAAGVGANNAHWGTFNTVVIPGQLSWALPNDFHVKTGLTVYLDDASSSFSHLPANKGVGSGNGFWTVQPDLGVSWLHDGWNLSMDAHYAYNFADNHYHNLISGADEGTYKSGAELAIDYTAAKTIGKWTFGIGAHQENQLVSDSGAAAAAEGCGAAKGCKAVNYGAGPLLGYQFESVSIMGEYNHNIYAQNDVAGQIFNVRLVAPF
jgi:hypothetical protein